MNRGRNQRHSNQIRGYNQNNNQLDIFGSRNNPFAQMHQIMQSGFGSGFGMFGRSNLFQNDDLFKDSFMMKPFQDPFQKMMNFSNLHQQAHNQGKNGSYVSQTFVSSSSMGPDGKVQKHSYYQNNAGQHKNGQTISQKQQAYRNNNGVNRIAEERMLNDKGHKVIKEKRGDKIQQMNHFFNIEQDEAQDFHRNWGQKNQQMRFLENHEKQMKSLGNGNMNERNRSNQAPQQLGLQYMPQNNDSRIGRNTNTRQSNNNNVNFNGNMNNSLNQTRDTNYSTKGSQRGSQISRGSRRN